MMYTSVMGSACGAVARYGTREVRSVARKMRLKCNLIALLYHATALLAWREPSPYSSQIIAAMRPDFSPAWVLRR